MGLSCIHPIPCSLVNLLVSLFQSGTTRHSSIPMFIGKLIGVPILKWDYQAFIPLFIGKFIGELIPKLDYQAFIPLFIGKLIGELILKWDYQAFIQSRVHW